VSQRMFGFSAANSGEPRARSQKPRSDFIMSMRAGVLRAGRVVRI
jgi:hypothetical protein